MADGLPIGAGEPAAPAGGRPIGGGGVAGGGGLPVVPSPAVGLPGASIEAPGAYFGSSPVGGPSSTFNIAGAPIAVLGGVFGGGLPIGGPVSQIFRSGAPTPPTLFIITLGPGGPIGAFFIGNGGAPIGGAGVGGAAIGIREGGAPIT